MQNVSSHAWLFWVIKSISICYNLLTPISVSSANPGATKATGPSMFGGDWANIRLEGGVVALIVLRRFDPDLCVSICTVFSLGETSCSLLVYLMTWPSSWFSPNDKNLNLIISNLILLSYMINSIYSKHSNLKRGIQF